MFQSYLDQLFRKSLCLLLILLLVFGHGLSYAQSTFVTSLPEPGRMVTPSAMFVPLLVKGLIVHPDKPLAVDFIVDSGDESSDRFFIKEQTSRIAKYFLAALTIPADELWVNLSPFEQDRIIENDLGVTVLGRDMLAQDYLLKQLTASLIYPEKGLGQEFWTKVYGEAQARFGTTDIPVDTFNKIWITPEKAEVFEKGNAVYVTQARLKVMLDTDYIALKRADTSTAATMSSATVGEDPVSARNEMTKQILREIILPAIEKEINEGENFAPIRQVYYAAILAKWYRELIHDTLLSNAYVGKNQVAGVTTEEKRLKEEIYQRYIAAFKKGVFDYIKDEPNPANGAALQRKYFSGGIADFAMEGMPLVRTTDLERIPGVVGMAYKVDLEMSVSSDAAMLDWLARRTKADVQLLERSWKRSILLVKLMGMTGEKNASIKLLNDKSLSWVASANIEKKVTGLKVLRFLFKMGYIQMDKSLADAVDKMLLYDESPVVKLAAVEFYERIRSISDSMRFLKPNDVKRVNALQDAFTSQKLNAPVDYVRVGVFEDIKQALVGVDSYKDVIDAVIKQVDSIDAAQGGLMDLLEIAFMQDAFSGLSVQVRPYAVPGASRLFWGRAFDFGTEVSLGATVLVWFTSRRSFQMPPGKFDRFVLGGVDKRIAQMTKVLETTTDRWETIRAAAFIASQPAAKNALVVLSSATKPKADRLVAVYAQECLINIASLHRNVVIRNNARTLLQALAMDGVSEVELPVQISQLERVDQAQTGGVDIKDIYIIRKVDGVKLRFNDQVVRDVLKDNFSGFTPVIMNITPVLKPSTLLGAQ